MAEMDGCSDLLKLSRGMENSGFLVYPISHLYNKIKAAVLYDSAAHMCCLIATGQLNCF